MQQTVVETWNGVFGDEDSGDDEGNDGVLAKL